MFNLRARAFKLGSHSAKSETDSSFFDIRLSFNPMSQNLLTILLHDENRARFQLHTLLKLMIHTLKHHGASRTSRYRSNLASEYIQLGICMIPHLIIPG